MKLLIGALLLCTFVACGGSSPSGTPSTRIDVAPIQDTSTRTWTCIDKTRVLLKSEDGTLHCIKF